MKICFRKNKTNQNDQKNGLQKLSMAGVEPPVPSTRRVNELPFTPRQQN